MTEFMTDPVKWLNDNQGLLAVILFIAGITITLCLFLKRKLSGSNCPDLQVELIEYPKLCSSFTVDHDDSGIEIHRTAFLVYLNLTNIGPTPIQVSTVNLGYRSAASLDPDEYRWLSRETVMLSDFVQDFESGEMKVFPFLKQQNTLIQRDPKTYLMQNEQSNGLVYFEQERSSGNDYPSMDEDCNVGVIVRVNDSLGNSWSVESLVPKVRIEAIREANPKFGLASESQ